MSNPCLGSNGVVSVESMLRSYLLASNQCSCKTCDECLNAPIIACIQPIGPDSLQAKVIGSSSVYHGVKGLRNSRKTMRIRDETIYHGPIQARIPYRAPFKLS